MTLLAPAMLATAMAATAGRPRVVLIHGLARTHLSMVPMRIALERAGYDVCNVSYPSRAYDVETLAQAYVAKAIQRCFEDDGAPVNFVAHSMGGIVVRQLAAAGLVPRFGRVVMLAPPNRGSEVVDRLGSWSLFHFLGGPAAAELGTSAGALPLRLGPPPFEAGVIAGSRSLRPVTSALIEGANDGVVSIEATRLAGMRDFLVVPVSHTFIAADRRVIAQTLAFLKHGRFNPGPGRPGTSSPAAR